MIMKVLPNKTYGEIAALIADIRKEKVNDLSIHLKKLRKKPQNETKGNRRKEIKNRN